MADHADIGPSGLYQVIACRGSMRMQRGKPNASNEHSRLGTAAHTVAAWCLEDERDAGFHLGRPVSADGQVFIVDEEMVEAVQEYLDYVRRLPGDQMWTEQKVVVPYIDTWGTGDALKIDRATRTLYVTDLKYGKGVFVGVEDNPQLKAYGIGGWHLLNVVEDIDIVEVAIVQPRIGNIAAERYTVDELIAWAKEIAPLVQQARTAEDAPLNPGEAQCRFCRAKADCPALRAYVEETVAADFNDETARPVSVAAIDFATVLPRIDLVEDWCKEVRAAANLHMLAGGEIAGYKVVEGRRGNRVWGDPAEVEKLMREQFRLPREEMYQSTVINPAAAERLLAKASPRRWKTLQEHITQSPGRPSVVPVGDKRAPMSVGAAVADDFSNIEDTLA